MPSYCCVPNCKNSGGHKFPKDPVMFRKWQIAIKRLDPSTKKLWTPSKQSIVCSLHFAKSDYTDTLLGERKRLKSEAVPSYMPQKIDESREKRINQRQKRVKKQNIPQSSRSAEETPILPDIGAEVDIISSDMIENSTVSTGICAGTQTDTTELRTQGIQMVGSSATSKTLLSVSSLICHPEALKYYTSLEDHNHFMFLFHILGPCVNHLCKNDHLTPENQFLLTLIKLRLAKDDKELAILFGVSRVLVSKVFVTWINFLYFQFQELNLWPDRDVIQHFMPENFKEMFPNTRVILDGTEIPIQKPGVVGPQRETFSSYKNKNTLKVVVGCAPRGFVSYISEAYGGSASDRQIIERSILCHSNMFTGGDSIMADRGIMVQDLFAAKDVCVNTPTMLKGKSQLEPDTVVKDRRVASKRIHIERIIGLAKTFKILTKEIQAARVPLANRIIFVCFTLVNFRPTIVNRYA